jgi:hypothetical protein
MSSRNERMLIILLSMVCSRAKTRQRGPLSQLRLPPTVRYWEAAIQFLAEIGLSQTGRLPPRMRCRIKAITAKMIRR